MIFGKDKSLPLNSAAPSLFPISNLQSVTHVVRRIGIAREARAILKPAASR